MNDIQPITYRVIQKGVTVNIPVTGFDGLVTHHPGDNRNAIMDDGEIIQGEQRRLQAFIDGEFQEIEIPRNGKTYGLNPDQVMLKKDFILEHPDHPTMSDRARSVDVPSPISGYVGRVSAVEGLVDIRAENNGEVIARIRHMSNIPVREGDFISYGQTIGIQSDVLTGPKHVHIEMDTRHFQAFRNYVNDLVSGRLPVQASLREGVQPLPVVDDNVARLGESSERVRQVQQALIADGYRATGDAPIVADGVYRRDLQGAVVAFQQDHGLRQTGDIDQATWQQAMHINRQQTLGPVSAQPQPDAVRETIPGLDMPAWLPQQDRKVEKLAPGDSDYGSATPPDPARTGRSPEWVEHEPHRLLRDHEQPQPPRQWPLPGLQPQPESTGKSDTTLHPDLAKLDDLRGRIEQLHAQHGLSLSPQEADNAAAALLLGMQKSGVKEAALVRFSVHADTQQVNPQGNLLAYGDYPLREHSATAAVSVQAATATPAETSLRELDHVRQQHAERDLVWQQQRERADAQAQQHGPGAPGMAFG